MAGGDPAAAAWLLGRALDLWRGPALGEFADRPFAAAAAMRLGELREAALEDLFDAELALGHHHEVVGGLEALVTSGPLRERRWGQLMLALYRDGRQAEAFDAFGGLRQILAQDLVDDADLDGAGRGGVRLAAVLDFVAGGEGSVQFGAVRGDLVAEAGGQEFIA